MAKYDSNANESFLLMFESTPLTARGRISGDLWYYDGESARLLEKRNRRDRTAAGDGNWESVCYSGNGSLRQKTGGCLDGKRSKSAKSFWRNAETIEATKDGVCTFYPAEKTVYDPLVSEWDSAEEDEFLLL